MIGLRARARLATTVAMTTTRTSIEASPDTSLKAIFNKANSMHLDLYVGH
jgi:hypothetical protein